MDGPSHYLLAQKKLSDAHMRNDEFALQESLVHAVLSLVAATVVTHQIARWQAEEWFRAVGFPVTTPTMSEPTSTPEGATDGT